LIIMHLGTQPRKHHNGKHSKAFRVPKQLISIFVARQHRDLTLAGGSNWSMFPHFPFSARVCLNQHHWLANQMREAGIDFQQCSNAFLKCSNFGSLQELADSLSARDLLTCGQKWLTRFTPFFTERERNEAACQHRLFFAQVEYCDNLIFRRRVALDQLGSNFWMPTAPSASATRSP
jgi:hypothetical protein